MSLRTVHIKHHNEDSELSYSCAPIQRFILLRNVYSFKQTLTVANKYIPMKTCDYISILLLPIQMKQFIHVCELHYSLFAENNIMNTKHIIIIILHFIHIPICNSFHSFTNPR